MSENQTARSHTRLLDEIEEARELRAFDERIGEIDRYGDPTSRSAELRRRRTPSWIVQQLTRSRHGGETLRERVEDLIEDEELHREELGSVLLAQKAWEVKLEELHNAVHDSQAGTDSSRMVDLVLDELDRLDRHEGPRARWVGLSCARLQLASELLDDLGAGWPDGTDEVDPYRFDVVKARLATLDA